MYAYTLCSVSCRVYLCETNGGGAFPFSQWCWCDNGNHNITTIGTVLETVQYIQQHLGLILPIWLNLNVGKEKKRGRSRKRKRRWRGRGGGEVEEEEEEEEKEENEVEE